MRVKTLVLITLIIVSFSLVSCNKKENTSATDNPKESEETMKESSPEDENSTVLAEEDQQSDDENMPDDSAEQEIVMIMLYCSNEDATAFNTKETQIATLSPDDVFDALVSEGVLTADIEILSFTTTEVEGIKSIDLNLSDSFASYVSGMGSIGEYYTIGSVCNTFLDAYGCEQIKITINGEILSTGHAEYPGYMTKFE